MTRRLAISARAVLCVLTMVGGAPHIREVAPPVVHAQQVRRIVGSTAGGMIQFPAALMPAFMRARQLADASYAPHSTIGVAGQTFWLNNKAQSLAVRFDGAAVRIEVPASPPLTLRTSGVQIGSAPIVAVQAVPWAANDQRVERVLAAGGLTVTEWYVNAPEGLEQGFTLDQRGRTRPAGDAVSITVSLGGDWTAALEAKGHGVRLLSARDESALSYGYLAAWDASGRVVPSRLDVGDGAITLSIDTAGAEYPITIDPLIHQAQLFGDPGQSWFGWNVALSGETAIVGAPVQDLGDRVGAAYVFTRSGSTWTQQARLNGNPSDIFFGWSVGLSGDVAVVGTPFANAETGTVTVFTRSGSTWIERAKLTGAGETSDEFGYEVMAADGLIFVGEVFGGPIDQGALYIFAPTGSTWTQQAKLVPSVASPNAVFGFESALYGDTLIVGAVEDAVNGNAEQGSAFIFTRNGTTWTEQAKLFDPNGSPQDFAGQSVAVGPDIALVGVVEDDIGANTNQGAVEVYTRSGTTWTRQSRIVALDGAANDFFGFQTRLQGDLAVITASGDDVGSTTNAGSAYRFARNGGAFIQQEQFSAPDASMNDALGHDIAFQNRTILVGSYVDDVGAVVNQGSTHVFVLPSTGGPTPSVSEVIPNSGSAAGGTAVTLKGSDLSETTEVTFDGVPVTGLRVLDSSTLTAITPARAAGAGTVNVTVRNSAGLTGTLISGFVYLAVPPPPPTARTLTVQLRGSGPGRVISVPAGIACGVDCTETYTGTPVVQLVAIPAADASFAGWVGDADCADGSVTMTVNHTCTARFERLPDGRTLDLNGDGLGDLIGYAPAAAPAVGGGIASVRTYAGVLRAGDVNGDRRSDVFAYDPATGAWSLEVNGAIASSGATGPRQSPLMFDVNGDALADVVFHDPVTGQVTPCIPTASGLACRAPATLTLSTALFPMDLNGDGRGDLLAYRWATGESSFLLGAADGSLTAASHTLAAPASQEIVVFDTNGDRRSDLVFSDPVSGAGTLFVNTGSGFTPTALGASIAGFTLRAANLDGDAAGDLIAYNAATGQTLQALNSGSGFTVTASTLPVARTIAVTDLNGDRRSDLVLYDAGTGAVTFAISQANGSFTQQQASGPPGLTILAQTGLP